MDVAEKVRENRVRRMAERQGLKVVKSRRKDPRGIGYGKYKVLDATTMKPVFGSKPDEYSATLDEVEAWLIDDNRGR